MISSDTRRIENEHRYMVPKNSEMNLSNCVLDTLDITEAEEEEIRPLIAPLRLERGPSANLHHAPALLSVTELEKIIPNWRSCFSPNDWMDDDARNAEGKMPPLWAPLRLDGIQVKLSGFIYVPRDLSDIGFTYTFGADSPRPSPDSLLQVQTPYPPPIKKEEEPQDVKELVTKRPNDPRARTHLNTSQSREDDLGIGTSSRQPNDPQRGKVNWPHAGGNRYHFSPENEGLGETERIKEKTEQRHWPDVNPNQYGSASGLTEKTEALTTAEEMEKKYWPYANGNQYPEMDAGAKPAVEKKRRKQAWPPCKDSGSDNHPKRTKAPTQRKGTGRKKVNEVAPRDPTILELLGVSSSSYILD
ncbi:hypothetical protein M413DRAFT_428117 [Hebeloma cylindrosporum]|uniref:Uncharacterized protein n=1 Tax=Hebeloma cylindrosporum TaxID=76867 RepID=A0A0C3BX30_HEBCY|nr:hypothetical protein M413DRAFT_428117 [Hebeloma cylindrosporum h7]